jgi:hypothetical protein
MQKTFNFNKPIIGLDGEALNDANGEVTLGKVLAPVIARQTQGDSLKLLSWAMAIHKNEDLVLDKSDIKTLKELINADNQMTALVKAPLLELLDSEK